MAEGVLNRTANFVGWGAIKTLFGKPVTLDDRMKELLANKALDVSENMQSDLSSLFEKD